VLRSLILVLAWLCLAPAVSLTADLVVVYQAETPAGWSLAEECHQIWLEEGSSLVARFLGPGAAPDSVTCLILESASFHRIFSGRIPEWGVGLALGNGRVVAIDYSRLPAVGRGVREVFLHEMVHALLFQGTAGVAMPAWLHEGAAMHYGGEWRFVDTVSLVLEGHVPDLSRLRGSFPNSTQLAQRAYRTSLLAVERLQNDYGADVIAELVVATRNEQDFAAAFVIVTGDSEAAFAADFSEAMRLRYGWLVMITRWPVMFVLLGFLLLIGGGRKLILARRRLAEMEAEERE